MKIQPGMTAYVFDSTGVNQEFKIEESKVVSVQHDIAFKVTTDFLDHNGENMVFDINTIGPRADETYDATGTCGRFYVAFCPERIRLIMLDYIDRRCDNIDLQKRPLLEAADQIKEYLAQDIYYKEGDTLFFSWAENYSCYLPKKATITHIHYTNGPDDPAAIENIIINDGDKAYEVRTDINSKHRVVRSNWRHVGNGLYIYICADQDPLIAKSKEIFTELSEPLLRAIDNCNKLLSE